VGVATALHPEAARVALLSSPAWTVNHTRRPHVLLKAHAMRSTGGHFLMLVSANQRVDNGGGGQNFLCGKTGWAGLELVSLVDRL
jgi:hypothetical protein